MKKSLLKVTALTLGLTSVLGVSLALVNNTSKSSIKANAADETYTFDVPTYATANSWANGVAQTEVTDGLFTFTVGGGGNNGKYYTSDTTWRFYGGGSLSIEVQTGYAISSVTVDAAGVSFASNNGKYTTSFTATTKIKKFTIVYAVSSAPTYSQKVFDLTKNETTTATTDQLAWYKAPITMEFNKDGSSTAANNYFPGTAGKTYTSTRSYVGSKLRFASDTGYVITSIVFAAGSETYANACANNTWKNATAVADGTAVTVTVTGDYSEITAAVSATQGFTKVTVNYKTGTAVTPEEPVETISTIQEVYEAAVASSTDEYTFIGTVTAMQGNSFYLQQGGYGFLVYNRAVTGIAIGKKVKVSATLQKYNGLYETKTISSAAVVEGEGETITPVQFATASEFLASRQSILASANGLTNVVEQTKASSSANGKYTANFGGTDITFTVDKFAYTQEIGDKLSEALASNFESLDIVGAPVGNYKDTNQFAITSASQLNINVRSVFVSSVTLNKTSLSLTAGGTGDTLTASVTMSDSSAYTGTVEWSTSDASVATVANGVVTPVNAGTATITAKAGSVEATCEVTVIAQAGTSYTKLVQYDFTDYTTATTSPAAANFSDSTLKTAFGNSVTFGSDLVTGVSDTANFSEGYYDSTNKVSHNDKGIKGGSSKNVGTFTIALSKSVKKIEVQGYGWNASEQSLTINNISKSFDCIYNAADAQADTLEYVFSSATDTFTFSFNKRGFIKTITLFEETTTPVTPDPEPTEDEFAIVAPDEMDFNSIMNYSFENALPESKRSAFVVWVANDDVQYSMNAPDSNEIDVDTTENAVITTLTSNRTFYIHAYYTVNATSAVVYATKMVTINYGLSNLVSDFGELRTYCNNGVNPNVSEITSTWEVLEAYWDDLSASEKATFKATVANASAATTTLENTAALYDLLVAKYNLTNFASRSVSSMSRGLKSITKDTATTTAIVAVAAISSISLVGALAVSKKRKEN